MKKFKIRTIDVWDTILRRKCHPDFIKKSTAYYFYIKYYNLHQVSDVELLFSRRVETEQLIGKKNQSLGYDDEYKISDVMLQWVDSFISPEVHNTQDIAQELYAWEIEQEKKVCYLDPGIKQFLEQYPADSTFFLSDFYMSAPDLTDLIQNAGMDMSLLTGGISSADSLYNKRSGRLFDVVKEQYQTPTEEWVHIGDNEWSDVKMPESKGINGIRYLPTEEHQSREFKESLWNNDEGFINQIINTTLLQYNEKENVDENFLLGLKTTPLIVGFCLKILEQAINARSEKIFFFTREGEFFIKAFERITKILKEQVKDLTLPEVDILEVSRLATFAPSLQEISLKEMMRVWNLYSTQSIGALFKTLNVDVADYQAYLDKYDINAEEQIQYPWQNDNVKNLFDDSAFKEALWQHVLHQRIRLKEYLTSRGISDEVPANICVVDVGWRGTIHDNIALLYPNIHFTGVYLGLQKFLNEQPRNTSKVAFGPDLNEHIEYPHFLDSVAPIEMITNSPSGSVIGYENIDGNVVAIRSVNADENNVWHNFTKTFQEGILCGIDAFSPAILNYGITNKQVRLSALKVWDVLISGNSKSLTEAFNNLNHNETFGLGGYVKKSHVPSLSEILSCLWNKSARSTLISFIKANQWSDGIRNRDNLSWLHRQVLAGLIDLAVFYKRKIYRR